jgi:1,4-dihydroxy-2-naphthoate octaprenyltransferase
MNKQEKTLYYLATLLVIVGAVLHISHVLNSSALMTFGFALALLTSGRYARRLKARTEELEEEVRQLRSAQI